MLSLTLVPVHSGVLVNIEQLALKKGREGGREERRKEGKKEGKERQRERQRQENKSKWYLWQTSGI